jgi:cysteinyl-tRNA synthetase, unknown class
MSSRWSPMAGGWARTASRVVAPILLAVVSASIAPGVSVEAAPNAQAGGPHWVYLPAVQRSQVIPSPSPTPPANDDAWASVDSWVYQLTNYKNGKLDEIAATAFDLAVIDLARDGRSGFFTKSEISALQATGKILLAYFEIGAIEDYRPEWNDVPEDLKLGPVSGWPGEQYVAYWDARWWPIVQGRVDQALAAGFDGAYLDMIVTYEEIPADAAGTNRDDLARKMVALIARLSAYAKARNPAFKVVPQNSPELYTVAGYLSAIDGLGMEELHFLATDRACTRSWCDENRRNAARVAAAGKLVLTVDYATIQANIDSAYQQSLAAGFVPYVTVVSLNVVRQNPGWVP